MKFCGIYSHYYILGVKSCCCFLRVSLDKISNCSLCTSVINDTNTVSNQIQGCMQKFCLGGGDLKKSWGGGGALMTYLSR